MKDLKENKKRSRKDESPEENKKQKMESKRELFPDTPVKKLLERIKVLEEEIPGKRVELPKEEIMSDLFWNLEK
jgi:hypothetical protein